MDEAVLDWFVDHRTERLTSAAESVTRLGGSGLLIPVLLVAGLVLLAVTRRVRPVLLLAAAFLVAHQITPVLKDAFGRERPPPATALIHLTDGSMPSGHATQAAACWGMLAIVVASQVPARWRPVVWGVGAVVVVLVGLSRLYLGVHWLTDVVAGWLLGALVCAAVVVVDRQVLGG